MEGRDCLLGPQHPVTTADRAEATADLTLPWRAVPAGTAHNRPHSPWKLMAEGERGGQDIPSPPHTERKGTGSPGRQRPAEEESMSSHFPFQLSESKRNPS